MADVQQKLRAMVGNIDVEQALVLENALEAMIAAFTLEHGELVRSACAVPEDDADVDVSHVVRCTILGHVLARFESEHGQARTEELVGALLAQFATARQQVGRLVGGPPQ